MLPVRGESRAGKWIYGAARTMLSYPAVYSNASTACLGLSWSFEPGQIVTKYERIWIRRELEARLDEKMILVYHGLPRGFERDHSGSNVARGLAVAI